MGGGAGCFYRAFGLRVRFSLSFSHAILKNRENPSLLLDWDRMLPGCGPRLRLFGVRLELMGVRDVLAKPCDAEGGSSPEFPMPLLYCGHGLLLADVARAFSRHDFLG